MATSRNGSERNTERNSKQDRGGNQERGGNNKNRPQDADTFPNSQKQPIKPSDKIWWEGKQRSLKDIKGTFRDSFKKSRTKPVRLTKRKTAELGQELYRTEPVADKIEDQRDEIGTEEPTYKNPKVPEQNNLGDGSLERNNKLYRNPNLIKEIETQIAEIKDRESLPQPGIENKENINQDLSQNDISAKDSELVKERLLALKNQQQFENPAAKNNIGNDLKEQYENPTEKSNLGQDLKAQFSNDVENFNTEQDLEQQYENPTEKENLGQDLETQFTNETEKETNDLGTQFENPSEKENINQDLGFLENIPNENVRRAVERKMHDLLGEGEISTRKNPIREEVYLNPPVQTTKSPTKEVYENENVQQAIARKLKEMGQDPSQIYNQPPPPNPQNETKEEIAPEIKLTRSKKNIGLNLGNIYEANFQREVVTSQEDEIEAEIRRLKALRDKQTGRKQ